MIKKLLFLLSAVILTSCQNKEGKNMRMTWIGGEIVNPKMNYVVLSKNHHPIDTIQLDDNNFFLYKSECLTEGLYSFQHYEYQIFYLEPRDSIMLRVNTMDFDESLTYTGKGAKKNNFLMEMYLINEGENMLLPKYYNLSPSSFQKKMDSLKKIRTDLYSEFVTKNSPNKNFKFIASANIDYDFYTRKELYLSVNESNSDLENKKKIPEAFYYYRKKIDLGSDELRSYYPYYRFISLYFDNISFQKYKEKDYFNRNSYLHNFHKLLVIDSLITNDSLKNNLLRTSMVRFLMNGKDAKKGSQLVTLFEKINNNKGHQREIAALAKTTTKLTAGNKIPNVLLVTTQNTAKDLQTIINRPTVLYFWSTQSIKHYKNMHSKAAELKSKFPEYDFIGINTDTHFKKWRSIVTKSGYNDAFEYQFEDIYDAEKKLVINSMNKALIMDKHATILEGNTNLYNSNIEALLLGYLNK